MADTVWGFRNLAFGVSAIYALIEPVGGRVESLNLLRFRIGAGSSV